MPNGNSNAAVVVENEIVTEETPVSLPVEKFAWRPEGSRSLEEVEDALERRSMPTILERRIDPKVLARAQARARSVLAVLRGEERATAVVTQKPAEKIVAVSVPQHPLAPRVEPRKPNYGGGIGTGLSALIRKADGPKTSAEERARRERRLSERSAKDAEYRKSCRGKNDDLCDKNGRGGKGGKKGGGKKGR